MIAKSGNKITPLCIPKCTSVPGLEIQRLTGRHFILKIIVGKKPVSVDHAKFVFLQNTKKTNEIVLNANALGMKVVMNVDSGVTLCVDPCFYIYHNYKDYMGKYIEMKKQ